MQVPQRQFPSTSQGKILRRPRATSTITSSSAFHVPESQPKTLPPLPALPAAFTIPAAIKKAKPTQENFPVLSIPETQDYDQSQQGQLLTLPEGFTLVMPAQPGTSRQLYVSPRKTPSIAPLDETSQHNISGVSSLFRNCPSVSDYANIVTPQPFSPDPAPSPAPAMSTFTTTTSTTSALQDLVSATSQSSRVTTPVPPTTDDC